MDTPIDMLQIKIEKAKDTLPEETKRAIAAVDWRAMILSLREKKGFSYEQLEDLELETELLLCGLLDPKDYPKEIENRLKLPKAQVDLLVSEMNELVFKKIRDELIKNTEKKELFINKGEGEAPLPNPSPYKGEGQGVRSVPSQLVTPPAPVKPALQNLPPKKQVETWPTNKPAGIPFQKLAGAAQSSSVQTKYSLDTDKSNLTGPKVTPISQKDSPVLKASEKDPYRLAPEE